MNNFETITCELAGPIATITLNQPATRNAMSNLMVEEVLSCFNELAGEEHHGVRAIVLRAAGSVFCAGGDLRDLSNNSSSEENVAALARVDEMLRTVNEAPQVVIACVQGAAMGGGLGLVCVSDIAIAAEQASFGLPEVHLGLAPSLISPYVVARMGLTRTRQLALTGMKISATTARDYALVHEVCSTEDLDQRVDATIGDVLQCAPQALRECKRLLLTVAAAAPDETLEYRIELLHRLQSGTEAEHGMQAFLQKQPAPWVVEP